MTDDRNQESSRREYSPDEGEYGLIERQLAFKLLAAHALVDGDFYQRLRDDPASAADELYIRLREDDLRYLKEQVNWKVLDERADEIRNALQTEGVVKSVW